MICRILFVCIGLLSTLLEHAAPIGGGTMVGTSRGMVNLTLADGLAGETVHYVMTDHNGYTWIATTGGVNVFNGRNLMTMRILNDKGHSLEVMNLCETRNHSVYAATEGGLYRLTEQSGYFERVLPEVEHPISLLAIGDTLFIGGEEGLHIFDGQQLKHQDVGIGRQGLDNIVRHFVRDDRGLVWFIGRHDLNSYDPATGRIDNYELISVMGGKQALTQFDVVEDKFFIGTRAKGLFVYDPKTREASQMDDIGNIVTSVRRSDDGLITVATDGSGAFLLEVTGGTIEIKERFSMDETGVHGLPTNALYSFYRDGNGVNWFGTVRCGLVYSPHISGLFRPYEPDGLSTAGMNVRSFLLHDSTCVIGLQDGLWLIDAKHHVRRFFSPEELQGHIVNNIQWWQGLFIVGLFDGGIRLLDPKTMTLRHQNWSPLLDKTTVGDIKIAPDSTLWIGCADGLFVLNRDGSLRQFSDQNSPIKSGLILNITFDAEGNAWLTGAKGLSLYSVASHNVVDARFPEGFFDKEPYMRGILGKDNMIYMRNGPLLFYTTSHMEQFGMIDLPLVLTDRWCRGMADDRKGKLWLASERGLLAMDYRGEGLMQIGEGEGLLGRQISEVHIDDDGRLWVATSEGLFTSSSEALSQWPKQCHYRITLFNVRKGSDLLDKNEMNHLNENHEIRLLWNMTSQVLQAEPLLMDYARQEGRLYEYRVDGGEWQMVDAGQPIDVRGLLMGSHQLTVRMVGIKGTETVYQLTVTPSAWAIFELILLIAACMLLWLWWRYRKNTKVLLSERDEMEEALIEVEQETWERSETKYQKVRIDEDECADIVRRMKEYIERERVYTNPELKRSDLAEKLHISPSKLSQIFTLYLKENYYEFINRYRLQEFKRLIEAGEYNKYTITALSEQCGFKKTSFFTTFRKVEGMTPAEYLKSHHITAKF